MPTINDNKRIAKNTLLLYVRMLLTMTVSLYTSRVVLNALGVEDFGIYNVVGGVVAMFTFINSAMAGASQRYLTFELGRNNQSRLHRVFCTSVNIHLLIAVFILLLAQTIGLWFLNNYMVIPAERFDAANWVFQLSVFSTMVMILTIPYTASIISHEKMSAFAYISILDVALKLFVVYMLLVSDIDKLKLYAVLMFCTQLLIGFIYYVYCRMNFAECRYEYIRDKGLLKEMSGFAGWTLWGNLAAVAFTQGLNILLNLFFGPVVNAARAVAVQVQNAIQGFVSNFQMAVNPQITKNYATGNMEQMHVLVFASGRYSFFLLFFFALPIFIEIESVLTFWLGIVPAHTVSFVRLILCIMLMDTLANPLVIAAQATGKIKVYQSVVGGILLLIVPVAYVVLKLGGNPESVFVVHLVMVILAQLARLLMIRPMIRLSLRRYLRDVVLKVAVVAFLSSVFPFIAYNFSPKGLPGFLLVCAVCVCSVLPSVFWGGLNVAERYFVQSKLVLLKSRITKR